VYLPSYIFEKEGWQIGGSIGGKVERIMEQRAGQCMDGWKSGLIREVDGAPTIEF
jgi:hypothetical protein